MKHFSRAVLLAAALYCAGLLNVCHADDFASLIPHRSSTMKSWLRDNLKIDSNYKSEKEWIGSPDNPGHTFPVFVNAVGDIIEVDSMTGELSNIDIHSPATLGNTPTTANIASESLRKLLPNFQFDSIELRAKPAVVDGVQVSVDTFVFRFYLKKGGIERVNRASVWFDSYGAIKRATRIKSRDDRNFVRPDAAGDSTLYYQEDTWLISYFGDAASPSIRMNIKEINLMFNGDTVDFLVFPPLLRDGNPLIFADYFPKFLIDTKREGDTITLSGQLPNKGKTAVLTLGSKEAIVDGKPFTLSGAPQEIEGRLYLPYELLHECNGVLVRWDAGKNTLWVDTRYLRRP